jgi:hypothetical protein
MSGMKKNIEEPVKILGYADDWFIYTSQKTPKMDENKFFWTPFWATKKKRRMNKKMLFKISTEKTIIHRRIPRVHIRPRIKIWIEEELIEITNQHRVLGLILDERINWKEYLNDTEASATKELKKKNLLKTKKKGNGDKTKRCFQKFIKWSYYLL